MKSWIYMLKLLGIASILFNIKILVNIRLCITILEYNIDLSRLKVMALDIGINVIETTIMRKRDDSNIYM